VPQQAHDPGISGTLVVTVARYLQVLSNVRLERPQKAVRSRTRCYASLSSICVRANLQRQPGYRQSPPSGEAPEQANFCAADDLLGSVLSGGSPERK